MATWGKLDSSENCWLFQSQRRRQYWEFTIETKGVAVSDILLKEISNFSMSYTIQVTKVFPAELTLSLLDQTETAIENNPAYVFASVVCLNVISRIVLSYPSALLTCSSGNLCVTVLSSRLSGTRLVCF